MRDYAATFNERGEAYHRAMLEFPTRGTRNSAKSSGSQSLRPVRCSVMYRRAACSCSHAIADGDASRAGAATQPKKRGAAKPAPRQNR